MAAGFLGWLGRRGTDGSGACTGVELDGSSDLTHFSEFAPQFSNMRAR